MVPDTEDSTKKMARFMLQGATMLDKACPLCNNPLFKLKNGDKACVVCERKVVYDSELADQAGQDAEASVNEAAPEESPARPSDVHLGVIFEDLKNACFQKLSLLAAELDRATQLDHITAVSQCILQVFSILDRVKLP